MSKNIKLDLKYNFIPYYKKLVNKIFQFIRGNIIWMSLDITFKIVNSKRNLILGKKNLFYSYK